MGNVRRPPRPGDGPAVSRAIVESPLQLLCSVEAHAAGLTPLGLDLATRSDVPSLEAASASLVELTLPPGVQVRAGGRLPTPPRPRGPRVVGDAFSGTAQSRLALRPPAQLIIVDDGLSTLDLVRRLTTRRPLVRTRQRSHALRAVLGARTGQQLRRFARSGRLVLFTALPLEPTVEADLRGLGVHIERNAFGWLRSRTAPPPPPEPVVVVGSGMVADQLIDPDDYVRWVQGLAARSPIRYIPHRRNSPDVLDALRTHPGVTVDEPRGPVEIRLRGLSRTHTVRSLPSTSALLLTTILGDGAQVRPRPVPDSWWTSAASPELRRHLSSILELTERARADASRGRGDAAPREDPSCERAP
ncbi:hypothetical protein [Serinicoccus kebangsaanensis]|uniref:hypothetical protein n=1 Tax=Serinicoccus kebangsaanensis TaxID=2602069 RepID=UPI00124C0E3D|nr:hypothetical protein [Serinicoccus kebangsaanensis]